MFWKKTLLAEHKSAGKDLGKATSQAFDYVQSLIREERQDEVPRYLIISDFARIVLHDALEAGGYSGHELERLLVRVLFCLFAEDTGIFDRNAFQMYLDDHTQADGSDVGPSMIQFFES